MTIKLEGEVVNIGTNTSATTKNRAGPSLYKSVFISCKSDYWTELLVCFK